MINCNTKGLLNAKNKDILYYMLVAACLLVAFVALSFVTNRPANAGGGAGCLSCSNDCVDGCADGDCAICGVNDCNVLSPATVVRHHVRGETRIMNAMRIDFHDHRDWFVDEYLQGFIPAMMLMAEQMSNVAMYQMFVVGKFFDAKSNLETQRLFNELQNEAAKDYQPSQSFCAIGTNIRSLSHSEQIAINTQGSMGQISMNRYMAGLNAASAYAATDADKLSRWRQFTTIFCNRRDNGWTGAGTGLVPVCTAPIADHANSNLDIDYHRLIEEPRYLDIDYSYDTASGDTTAQMEQASIEEQAVIALSRNLYGHNVPNSAIGFITQEGSEGRYLALRSVIAKRNVAQNSYNAIVGMKARGSGGGSADSAQFLRAVVADLGMTEPDIDDIFGDNPSYYGQLEVLGKKIFQSTDFFTDLYEKPANVKRKQVALNAIELMLDRAIFESELRNEMLMSVLLSSSLESERELVHETYKDAKP